MLPGMRNRTRVEFLLAAAVLGGLMATGCMLGRIQPGSAAYVHVAANGVVTFWGAPVDLDKLPKRLKDAGVASNTLIKIVPHGEVSNRILHGLAANLARNGLPKVVIVEPRKAVTIVDGQTVEEVAADEDNPQPSRIP